MYGPLRAWLLYLMPPRLRRRLKAEQTRRRRAQVLAGPALERDDFRALLRDRLRVRAGGVLCVHSSVDLMHLRFPILEVLNLLQEAVGPQGTLMFPVFPMQNTHEILSSGKVFDVRRSAGYSGLLGELARRHPEARRSLHPTRSVVAIGPRAAELVATHAQSPYPFGTPSPYFKLKEWNGQIIGLGVSSKNLTFIHVIDDFLGADFPWQPYHERLFQARCVDAEGREVIVPTYAHRMTRMRHDIPRYLARHVPPEIARDLSIGPMNFFTADAAPLFDLMVGLARRGITVYHP